MQIYYINTPKIIIITRRKIFLLHISKLMLYFLVLKRKEIMKKDYLNDPMYKEMQLILEEEFNKIDRVKNRSRIRQIFL